MGQRGHTDDGDIICSACGGIIDGTTSVCILCEEPLDGDFKAMVCPYCSTVLEKGVPECSNCGLKFKAERKVNTRSQEDEEFLSRLLEWGKKKMAEETPSTSREDIEEEATATDTFKVLLGTPARTSFEEDNIRELQKEAEEMSEFEKREESILKLARPLQAALKSRRESLNRAEKEIAQIRKELEGMNGSGDPETLTKRSELERRMSEISVERDEIRSLEENINNMDQTYRRLLETHQQELVEKEQNLQARLDAFKKERERRDKQVERMKVREEILKKKEKELEVRINSLKSREASLRKTEDEMKKTIAALQEEKAALEMMKTAETREIDEGRHVIPDGMWLISEDELRGIMKKNKKIREEWLETQNEIQGEIAGGMAVEDVKAKLEEDFARKEIELTEKISALEKKLAEVTAEEKEISREADTLSGMEEDIKKVLSVVDDLLGNLPEELIEKFANSDDFKIYEKVMDELEL